MNKKERDEEVKPNAFDDDSDGRYTASILAKKLRCSTGAIKAMMEPTGWYHVSDDGVDDYYYGALLVAADAGELTEDEETHRLLDDLRAWHLPGPWEARKTPPELQSPDKIGDGIEYDVITDYDDSAQLFVADCGCQPESESNARLIAAAPDMLALLRRWYNTAAILHGGDGSNSGNVFGATKTLLDSLDNPQETQ